MKPETLSFVFALIVVAANWHSSRIYEQTSGTTKLSIDGAGLAVLFCLCALFLISRKLYQQIRLCLDREIRIPYETRFIQYWPCFFLFPLLIRWNMSSADITPEGIRFNHSFGYGSDLSVYALLLCILTILTFQFYKGVSKFVETGREAGSSNQPPPTTPDFCGN